MEYKAGMVVKSVAGHDGGSYYAVLKAEGGFVYIADGRERKVDKPKKKNVKHISKTCTTVELDGLTDKGLREKLHSLNFGNITEECD